MAGPLKGLGLGLTRESVTDLTGAFSSVSRNTDYTNMAVFDTAGPDANANVTVADFSDQDFSHDSVQAINMDAASGMQGADVQLNEADIQAKQDQYMQADAEIKECVVDAINEVMGPEAGKGFADHIFPDGAPTKFQAAATMMDPTGVAGSIYSVLNAVAQQADRYGTQESLEVLDRVLNKLQESNNPAVQQAFNNDNYFPPKEGYDFSKITPTQLLEFLQRKPEQDPIMQDLQRSLEEIAEYKENVAINEANIGDHDSHKLNQAIAAGHEADVREMTGDIAEAEAVELCTAYAVDIARDGLNEPGLVHANMGAQLVDQQFASIHEIKNGLTTRDTKSDATLDREAELDKIMESFKPGGNSMMV